MFEVEPDDEKKGSILSPKARKTVGGLGILGSVTGMLYSIDPNSFAHYLSATANNQIAQAGFFFTAAAWIHSGRVKKEIKENFTVMTDAINNVATALRLDLASHAKRLDNLETRVDSLRTTENP